MCIPDSHRFSLFLLSVVALSALFAHFVVAEPAQRSVVRSTVTASSRLPHAFISVPRDGTVIARRHLDKSGGPRFSDVDLLADEIPASVGRAQPAFPLEPAAPIPMRLRELAPDVRPRDANLAKAGGPWSDDHLLADATHMNDENVSLGRSPASGDLYAVFAATDLGGTDRDIHIARSSDDGATWDQWEMPSFSQDEFDPELAVDDFGYLYVVWLRDDGYIVRTRSLTPDDTQNWDGVYGFFTDSINASPAIAVTGTGSRATVFVAAAYQEINWDLYAWEWTLVWFWSTDGGTTTSFDALAPDGYPDLWPDVAMSGTTVHLINGEADANDGPTQILLASDTVDGTFDAITYLTSWTEFSAGFPHVAAQGESVFAVFQHDWDDGAGNLDGDVIYCYSEDNGATVLGPYEIVADEYDSVGPTIYASGGYVGCLWLETYAGGDEYEVISRQSDHDGLPESWPDWVEIVSEYPYAEPQYRFLSGVVGADDLHAGWIDRRDAPTQGHNVYTSERPLNTIGTDVETPTVLEAKLTVSPNPFNPRTVVSFHLPSDAATRLELFDARGRSVRTLVDASLPAGDHEAIWDGSDANGRPMPTGTYLARLSRDSRAQTAIKLSLIR